MDTLSRQVGLATSVPDLYNSYVIGKHSGDILVYSALYNIFQFEYTGPRISVDASEPHFYGAEGERSEISAGQTPG